MRVENAARSGRQPLAESPLLWRIATNSINSIIIVIRLNNRVAIADEVLRHCQFVTANSISSSRYSRPRQSPQHLGGSVDRDYYSPKNHPFSISFACLSRDVSTAGYPRLCHTYLRISFPHDYSSQCRQSRHRTTELAPETLDDRDYVSAVDLQLFSLDRPD